MKEDKKTMKIIIIISLTILFLVVSGIIIALISFNRPIEESKYTTISNVDSSTETKEKKYEKEMKELKDSFSSSEIEIVDDKCNTVEETLKSMLQTLILNDKINSKWKPYCYSKYSEHYNDNYYYISFNCDINDIKTTEEMEELVKDCTQIIWETINIIYSNPNINNYKNKYFEEINFNFSFNYNFIDNYGNTKNDKHNLYFDITRISYNSINMETFPEILKLDYTKMFGVGKATYNLGKQGIQIDFKNLITK